MKVQRKKKKSSGGSGGARSLAGARQVTVLHIDDDPNDSELFRAATTRAGVSFVLQNVQDGEQAIAYLSGEGVYSDRKLYPLPSLIILDLKLPRATGFEILQWIRSQPAITDIPVVVLSGSELQDDKHRAVSDGANSYHVKPLGFEALVCLVKDLNLSWLGGQQSLPLGF
jgi:CheY-like chemotaxis protein